MREDHASNWFGLAALSLGMVLLFMNTTMINVALPALSAGLGASTGGLEWVVSSYNLAFLVVLLPGGALGDRLGHRRLLVAGVVGFCAGACLAAVSTSAGVLIAARVVMGLAASVFTPMSLALIPQMFDDARKALATATWTAAGAVGAPLGPLIGGSMIDRWGWRAMFWLDIAVAVVVLAMCLRLVPVGRPAAGRRSLPVVQVVAAALGLALITWGLINAEHTWSAPATWSPIAAGALALAVFVVVELRARDRLTDLGLLAHYRFRVSSLVLMGINFVLFGLLFVTPDYLQTILGHDAAAGGLMLMPVALTAVVGAVISSGLSRVRAARELILPAAMALAAAGLWLCSTTSATSGYRPMFWGLLIAGLGLGIGQAHGIQAAMSAVPSERGGAGAALLNAIRQLGAVLGIALLGSLTGNRYGQGVADLAATLPDPAASAVSGSVTTAFAAAARMSDPAASTLRAAACGAYIHAMHVVLAACAVVTGMAAVVLLALAVVHPRRRTAPAAARPAHRIAPPP